MASNALTIRFVTTERSCSGSAVISGRSEPKTRSIAPSKRTRERAVAIAASTSETGSSGPRWRAIGRTNSKLAVTVSATDRSSPMISSTRACSSGRSERRLLSNPAMTSMPASGFRISWARSAAICPRAVSRSRSRTCSSMRSKGVRSRKIMAAPQTRNCSSRTGDRVKPIVLSPPSLTASSTSSARESGLRASSASISSWATAGWAASNSLQSTPTADATSPWGQPRIRWAPSFIITTVRWVSMATTPELIDPRIHDPNAESETVMLPTSARANRRLRPARQWESTALIYRTGKFTPRLERGSACRPAPATRPA